VHWRRTNGQAGTCSCRWARLFAFHLPPSVGGHGATQPPHTGRPARLSRAHDHHEQLHPAHHDALDVVAHGMKPRWAHRLGRHTEMGKVRVNTDIRTIALGQLAGWDGHRELAQERRHDGVDTSNRVT
jgi:hypothetical protein